METIIKRERGRPPKAPANRKSAELRIRLTEAEREFLDRVAQDVGGTSTWAREVLMKAARNAAKR